MPEPRIKIGPLNGDRQIVAYTFFYSFDSPRQVAIKTR